MGASFTWIKLKVVNGLVEKFVVLIFVHFFNLLLSFFGRGRNIVFYLEFKEVKSFPKFGNLSPTTATLNILKNHPIVSRQPRISFLLPFVYVDVFHANVL